MGNVRWLCCFAFVLPFYITTGGDDFHQVTELIGGSIKLPLQHQYSGPIKEMVWKFVKGSQMLKIAEMKDNKLEIHHPQFENRLGMRDGKELYINNATINDAGIYMILFILANNSVIKEMFNVSLYEPVPAPSITIKYENGTMMVYCNVPANTTHLFYTWKYRYNDSDYQLLNNTKDRIPMSLHPKRHVEVLCIVWNPADSKNVSVQLELRHQEGRHHWFRSLPVAFFFVLSIILLTKCWKKTKLSVMETDHTVPLRTNYLEQEVSFPILEKGAKYSHPDFIELH